MASYNEQAFDTRNAVSGNAISRRTAHGDSAASQARDGREARHQGAVNWNSQPAGSPSFASAVKTDWTHGANGVGNSGY